MLSFLSLTAIPANTPAGQSETTVTVSLDERMGTMDIDHIGLGQGGLSSEPMWDSRIPEIRALRPRLIRLFIQEYFGLLPRKGRYDFAKLDRSVDTILKTGAKPLMCICFKPRALFPEVDQDVVEPRDYEAWERLVGALVEHYKRRGAGIRYWEVANEPDIGEDGGCPYRFKPDSYARYYERTARAILRADPDAKVGGPALANVRSDILPALLDACSAKQIPLHFVSWHTYTSSPDHVRSTIDYAKGLLKAHPSLHPETVLDEWNMDLMNPPQDPRFQPCYVLETAWQMKDAGLDWSCYYHIRDWHVEEADFAPFMSPHGVAFMARWWNRMPQFDGLFDYQNTMRPAYFAFKLLSRLTGERLRVAVEGPARVHAFATRDGHHQVTSVLVWNFSGEPAKVRLKFAGPGKFSLIRHEALDAVTASNEENTRLKPDSPKRWAESDREIEVMIEPYGVQFWSLE